MIPYIRRSCSPKQKCRSKQLKELSCAKARHKSIKFSDKVNCCCRCYISVELSCLIQFSGEKIFFYYYIIESQRFMKSFSFKKGKLRRNIYLLTWGDEMIVYKHGNRTGTNSGTNLSSKSSDIRARHFRAPRTAPKRYNCLYAMTLHKLHYESENCVKHPKWKW